MLFENKIILGSKSPRRRELIKNICKNVDFIDIVSDESYPSNLKVEDISSYIAQKKSNFLKDYIKENEILITSDTVVILDDKIIGKPENKIKAKESLMLLSEKMHIVNTACCIADKQKTIVFCDTTEVYFKKLSENEIDFYIENFSPLDKAGSYGIQEWIGFIGIKKISGCFYNVMGLPLNSLYRELNNFIFSKK